MEFDQLDYHVREGQGNNLLQVVVRMQGEVAHDLILKVTPLNFVEAEVNCANVPRSGLVAASSKSCTNY